MKIRITLKDPDGVYDSKPWGMSHERFVDYIRPWVEFQEYVVIEIDTDFGTAEVVKVER